MMVVNLADIENGYGSSLPLVPLRSEQYEPVGTKRWYYLSFSVGNGKKCRLTSLLPLEEQFAVEH